MKFDFKQDLKKELLQTFMSTFESGKKISLSRNHVFYQGLVLIMRSLDVEKSSHLILDHLVFSKPLVSPPDASNQRRPTCSLNNIQVRIDQE